MLVGIAVSAADPSGLWGTLKEAAACSSALSGANGESSANELVQAVRTEFEKLGRTRERSEGIARPICRR